MKDVLSQEPNAKVHRFDEVLKLFGFGRTQWFVLLTVGLFLMFVINETSGMSIIAIASQCDFALTSVQKGWISSSSFFGILVSSYFWGYISDRIGRRISLLYAAILSVAVAFSTMILPNFWLFVVARFFVGFFIAGASSTVYAYLGEFYLPHHRPVIVNASSVFVGLSFLYTPVVGKLVLSMEWEFLVYGTFSFRPWRLLILFNLLPGLLAGILLWFLPESPKLLLSRHRYTEAYRALEKICMLNTGKTLADLKISKVILEEEEKDDIENSKTLQQDVLATSKSCFGIIKEMWSDTIPLFQRPHVANFLLSTIVMFGLLLSSSGVGVWYPEILNRVGQSNSESSMTVCHVIDASVNLKSNTTISTECDDTITAETFNATIVMGVIYVVGFIVLGLIINIIGRKNIICGSLILSGIFGLSMIWVVQPIILVANFIIFLVLPGLCVSVLAGAMVDLVPTQLRGKALCIGFMLGRAGGVVGINLLGSLLELYCSATFSVVAVFMIICGAITFTIPI